MSERVEIEFERVLHETSGAYLVLVEGAKVWLPKSQLSEWHESPDVAEPGGSCEIPEWLAVEKGLV